MKKLLLVLVLLMSFSLFACGSKFKGKYSYIDLRLEKAALYFEDDKVRYTVGGNEVGTYDFTYNNKTKTLTIHMEEDLVFVYDRKDRSLSADIYKDGISRVFFKDNY